MSITVSMCAMAVFGICGFTAIVLAVVFRFAHPGPGFYGQVVDLSGHPVAGARIRLEAHWTDRWTDGSPGIYKPAEIWTEPDGRFTFPRTYESVSINSITKGTLIWRGSPRTRYALPSFDKLKNVVHTNTTYDQPMRFTLDTGFTYYSSAD